MSDRFVLLVDDNEADRYLLRRDLRAAGVSLEVIEKADGKEAITFLESICGTEKAPPCDSRVAIFLDINMPLVDGWGVLDAFQDLRRRHGLESWFVVMFTTSEHPDDVGRAKGYDFVKDSLTKGSISRDTLRALLA